MSVENLGHNTTAAPIMISGVYRSGTTILAQMIKAHPGVALTYDSVKFLRFCLGRFDPVTDPENYRKLVAETHRRVSERWNMEFDVDTVVAAIDKTDGTYADVYDALMREAVMDGPGDQRRWGEKIALMWREIPHFLNMFPHGQVIHIFRDPRDVTASYKKITFEPGYTYLDAAFNCLDALKQISRFQKAFGPDRIMAVRMEDLLDDPEIWARRMCEFLKLPFDSKMLDSKNYKDKAGQTWSHNSGFNEGMRGISNDYTRWKAHLTPTEIAFVEMIVGDEMRAMGYEPSAQSTSPKKPTGFDDFLSDPFLAGHYTHWRETGEGQEGYRTDPVGVEMAALNHEIEEK